MAELMGKHINQNGIEPVGTQADVETILDRTNLVHRFRMTFWCPSFGYSIQYGKDAESTTVKASSFSQIAGLYNYNSKDYPSNEADSMFKRWSTMLHDLRQGKPIDVLLTVLEIFDWGGVTTGNLKEAIDLYRAERLVETLETARKYLTGYCANEPPSQVPFSSGWTKVYSFLCPMTVIYDSRFSAFLNYSLLVRADESERNRLKPITSCLFNFAGVTRRQRALCTALAKECRLYSYSTKNEDRWLRANLVASWVVKYLAERLLDKENGLTQAEFRVFDKAFYMLGFDLKQLTDCDPMLLKPLSKGADRESQQGEDGYRK